MKPNPLVSIIIPTQNSANLLPLCLKSIKQQNYPQKETIIIDNYSTDQTSQIAQEAGAQVLLRRGTQAYARNAGVNASKAPYVLFLDSDQQLRGNVLEDCVQKCETKGIQALKIPETFFGLNFWGKCSALWKNNQGKTSGQQGSIPRFYNRQTLLQASAFNRNLRWGEDSELYERLKTTGIKESRSTGSIVHLEGDTLKGIVKKYLSYGKSAVALTQSTNGRPVKSTLKTTLSVFAQTIKNPGKSPGILLGCLFLLFIKALTAATGFLTTKSTKP